MRIILIWIAAAFVFGSFYTMVERKEALRRDGQTVFLALAPADPRSPMQGDYMALNYEVMNQLNHEQFDNPNAKVPDSGVLVIQIDNQTVGQFVRLHQNEGLAPGEHLLKFHRSEHDRIYVIGAETYFIPEGEGPKFAEAKYGELKVEPDGTPLLVSLCDKDRTPIDTTPVTDSQ